jgi:hypothetical protein
LPLISFLEQFTVCFGGIIIIQLKGYIRILPDTMDKGKYPDKKPIGEKYSRLDDKRFERLRRHIIYIVLKKS